MRPSFNFVVGIFAVLVAALPAPLGAGAGDESFTDLPSAFSGSNFADLGVVDADGDGIHDLYISSHISRTVLLLGDGAGGFRDVSDAWGLAVDERVPYIESSADVPASPEGGLHLYFESERLVARAHPSDEVFEGRIEFSRPVAFAADGEVKATGAKGPDGPRPRSPFIEFETRGAGELTTTSWFPYHQVLVKLAPDTPLDRVFLGRNAVPAFAREMTLSLVDRHGLAWADFDGDADADPLVTVPGAASRLFINRDGRFEERTLADCPTDLPNHIAVADFDADGDRDCVCTVARDGKATEHFHFRNDTEKHRGFAVDVIGPPLNRQAIGATMMASVGGVVRRHMVGEADGAHWSQGHYRIYVSLGAAEKADWFEVLWPDGARRRVEPPAAGERIEIRWQDSAKRDK